jgi:hypothetical protein
MAAGWRPDYREQVTMTDRFQKRAEYIEGWYQLDAEKLFANTTRDFIFDDPREPAPVNRDGLVAYMYRWDAWTREKGAGNHWILEDEVRHDSNGILIDWEWWELPGSGIFGMALVKTRDEGVFLERITYFDRKGSAQ